MAGLHQGKLACWRAASQSLHTLVPGSCGGRPQHRSGRFGYLVLLHSYQKGVTCQQAAERQDSDTIIMNDAPGGRFDEQMYQWAIQPDAQEPNNAEDCYRVLS